MGMLPVLDHPVTQKFLLAVATASFVGVGGVAYNSNLKLERHDVQIEAGQKNDTLMQETVVEELKEIRRDVGEIKTGVAVVEARTAVLEKYAETHGDDRVKRPRP